MKAKAFDAVLFDIGDTLIHFETWKARRYVVAAAVPAHEHLQKAGHRPPPLPRYVRTLKGGFLWAFLWSRLIRREVRLLATLRRAHGRMGVSLKDEQFVDMARQCLPKMRELFVCDPHAVAVVSRLCEAGLKLGIVSNTFFPRFAIDDVMQHEGLLPYFPVCIYSSDIGFMKPHRRIFEQALLELGVTAGRTLFVGDRISKDIRGAARLGMTTALLKRTGRAPWYRFRPDHVVRCLREIPGIVGLNDVGE